MSGSGRPLAGDNDEWKQWVQWGEAEQDAAGQSTRTSEGQKGKQKARPEAEEEEEEEEEETPLADQIPGGLANPVVTSGEGVPKFDESGNRMPSDELQALYEKAVHVQSPRGRPWPKEHEEFFVQYQAEYGVVMVQPAGVTDQVPSKKRTILNYDAMRLHFDGFLVFHDEKTCSRHKAYVPSNKPR